MVTKGIKIAKNQGLPNLMLIIKNDELYTIQQNLNPGHAVIENELAFQNSVLIEKNSI